MKELPDGYVLWQQLKYSVDTTRQPEAQKKAQNSTTNIERNDVFLFGHPGGRNKRFRSPQEFYPHLLWLATDIEGDRLNCSCKNCFPDKRNAPEALDEEEVKANPEDDKTGNTALVRSRTASTIHSVAPTALTPSSQNNRAQFVRSPEQEFDREASGKYLYRPGELVWFSKGPAWGLAVICKRRYLNTRPQYLLQPLSHPLHHPSWQIKDQDSIRPWLAWSLPQTTHTQIRNLGFDQVPWDRVIRGDFGPGDAEVDGSILASKAVDGAYSLFDRLQYATATGNEVYYNGMFLGGEKIWVGEPVRVSAASEDIVVLVVEQIIERTSLTPPTVTLVGDVYKFVEMPTPYKDRASWPTQSLPPRMIADLRFRNEVADNAKQGIWYEWRLLEPAARKGLVDIKGRWYESRFLIPILRGPEEARKEISRGLTSDASVWMNARGDNSSRQGQRNENRLDTLGEAVPKDLKISQGLNGLPEDDIFLDQQPTMLGAQATTLLAGTAHYQQGLLGRDGNVQNFMDVDRSNGQEGYYNNTLQR